MKTVDINGTLRTDLGKKATRADRKEGKVPGVIYGGGEVVHFNANPKEMKDIVFTPAFKKATVTVGGKKYNCILKDTQFHPVTDALLHVDFLELIDGQDLKANIPVLCEGTAAGVKEGGRLNQKLRRVTVKTTPDKLIAELTVDVTALNLGDSVRVKDIKFSGGMEVMTDMSIPVATIEVPRSMRSALMGEEEGEEGAAPGAAAAPDAPEA
ncbi:MAG: large subunit ribosomal protein L25 [Patescibacteria group bacterium]|jgi:large subunit ribosomal protein L25